MSDYSDPVLFEEFHHPNNALVRALRQLLDAPTKEEADAVLHNNRALLLTEGAAELLEKFKRASWYKPAAERLYHQMYIGYHKILLLAARKLGIPGGWVAADEFAAGINTSREAMRTWKEKW
jgi:hypothetical protein